MNLPTVPAKTTVHKNKSTAWFGTEYTMNLYKGCCPEQLGLFGTAD